MAALWIKLHSLNIAQSSFFTLGEGDKVTTPCCPIYQRVGLCFWCRFLKEEMFLKQSRYGFSEGELEKSSISKVKMKSLMSIGH